MTNVAHFERSDNFYNFINFKESCESVVYITSES